MTRRIWLSTLVGFGALFLVNVRGNATTLQVKLVDTSQYYEDGKLVFIVQARDETTPIENLLAGTWKLFYGERQLEAVAQSTKLSESGIPSFYLIVFPVTANFMGSFEGSEQDSTQLPPIEYVLKSISSLLGSLGSHPVYVAYYMDGTAEPRAVTTRVRPATRVSLPSIERLKEQLQEVSESGSTGYPALQTALTRAVQKWLDKVGQTSDRVARLVVVVFTDGNSSEKVEGGWIRRIAESVAPQGRYIELYVIGMWDGGNPTDAKKLGQLGVVTGVMHRFKVPEATRTLSPLIMGAGTYAVAFALDESIEGQAVNLTVAVTEPSGRETRAEPYLVQNLKRKTSWLKITLMILGGIAGLTLLIVIIRAIVAAAQARRERLAQEEAASSQMMYTGPSRGKLYALKGPAAGMEFPLTEDLVYIGRSPENHIVIVDPTMGKRHAAIHIKDRIYEIEDLQSVNGVFINNLRVAKAFLKDGDTIRLGETELQFKL